jgi:hypothetical protein
MPNWVVKYLMLLKRKTVKDSQEGEKTVQFTWVVRI